MSGSKLSEMVSSQTLVTENKPALLPKDRRACGCICNYIIVQCLLVFVGASTIQHCLWSPEHASLDYDKLVRIMYLYDSHPCGHSLRASRSTAELELSNDTDGLDVLPIKRMPAVVTVSTRLSAKTRRYMELSIAVHVIWLIVTIFFKLMCDVKTMRLLKLGLTVLLYASIFMVTFDLSMAIVYIAHIQQSLTKGMILRYSGWNLDMKLTNYEEFGGWLPIAASICWMRGIIFLGLNIYCCRKIHMVKRRIKKREVKKKLMLEDHPPIPEPEYNKSMDNKTLYFRNGERKPFVNRTFRFYE